jgi:hypothetical protein
MVDPTIDMAQVEALHVALQQSFSPDRSIRDPAEASIKQLKFVPGATQMLLHITEEKQVRDTCGMFILLESPRCIADFGLYLLFCRCNTKSDKRRLFS